MVPYNQGPMNPPIFLEANAAVTGRPLAVRGALHVSTPVMEATDLLHQTAAWREDPSQWPNVAYGQVVPINLDAGPIRMPAKFCPKN